MLKNINFDQNSLEQSVLSFLLKNIGADVFSRNLSSVRAEMITNKSLRMFVVYAKNQVEQTLPVDLNHFLHEVIDGDPTLNRGDIDIAINVNPSSSFDSYISQLNKNYIQKVGSDKIRELHHSLSSDSHGLDVLIETHSLYRELLSSSGDGVVETFSQDSDDYMNDLNEEWSREQQGLGRVKIGLNSFDHRYSGLKDGELVILGARPSMGKTSMALSMALGALESKSPHPVVIFSGEMSPRDLKKKLISMYSYSNGFGGGEVPLSALMQFHDFESHRENIASINHKMKELFEHKLIIVDSIGKDVYFIQKELAKIYNKYGGITAGFLDYIQIVKLEGKKARHEEIGDVSMSFKIMASEMNFPFVVLAQLNRELEKRENKRPTPSDLKDSGSIEQDADVIMFVYRDSVYKAEEYKQKNDEAALEALNSTPLDKTEIIIGKNRNGPIGTVALNFHKTTTRFVEPIRNGIDTSPPIVSRDERSTPSFDMSMVNPSSLGEVSEAMPSSIVDRHELEGSHLPVQNSPSTEIVLNMEK